MFRDALEILASDDFPRALELLDQGMAANDFSADLNRDMAALEQRIREAMPQQPEPNNRIAGGHVLLHGYRKPE